MASPSGSPKRGRTLALDGIPYDTQPSKVLERLQAMAGRLQRACTNRSSSSSSPSMAHSLATQQRQRQRQQECQQRANLNESASIPGCPCHSLSHSPRVYSLKAEFSTREAANKARDLLIAQPQPDSHHSHHNFLGFNDVGILPNFVLDEEDTLLEIPAIISTGSGCSGCSGCGVCGVCGGCAPSPSPRSEDIHGRRTSAERIDPTRKHPFTFICHYYAYIRSVMRIHVELIPYACLFQIFVFRHNTTASTIMEIFPTIMPTTTI